MEQQNFTPLSVIDSKTLLALDCEPPRFIISWLLPTGLSVLAGSPKVGKSWLSLWLCQQVSHGLPVWEFNTLKSTMLYLALEDTIDRLHFRLSHITENGTEDFHFTTNADCISSGLLPQLEQFISNKPDTRLIVIDTLQRIRGTDENRCGYAFDYDDMNKIKALADRLKIAIFLVHHTRKTPDNDPFNTVSGTTGLTGSADTMFVLEKAKRAENSAILHIAGLDVEDMQINLEFDRERKIRQFVSFVQGGENPAVKPIETVVKLMSERKSFSGTATELLSSLKELDKTIIVTPNVLSRMLKDNSSTLENTHKIIVSFERSGARRTVKLNKNDDDGDFNPHPLKKKQGD